MNEESKKEKEKQKKEKKKSNKNKGLYLSYRLEYEPTKLAL